MFSTLTLKEDSKFSYQTGLTKVPELPTSLLHQFSHVVGDKLVIHVSDPNVQFPSLKWTDDPYVQFQDLGTKRKQESSIGRAMQEEFDSRSKRLAEESLGNAVRLYCETQRLGKTQSEKVRAKFERLYKGESSRMVVNMKDTWKQWIAVNPDVGTIGRDFITEYTPGKLQYDLEFTVDTCRPRTWTIMITADSLESSASNESKVSHGPSLQEALTTVRARLKQQRPEDQSQDYWNKQCRVLQKAHSDSQLPSSPSDFVEAFKRAKNNLSRDAPETLASAYEDGYLASHYGVNPTSALKSTLSAFHIPGNIPGIRLTVNLQLTKLEEPTET